MIKTKFKKILSVIGGALLIGSTVAGVGSAALFPQPFVQNNNLNDVAIVVGSNADASDLTAAGIIRDELLDQIDGGGNGNGTSGGDSFKIERASERLNLGESLTDIQGARIDDDDLELLSSNTFLSQTNEEFDYDQYIQLAQNLTLQWFDDEQRRGNNPVIGIEIDADQPILTYTMDFADDLQSDVTNNQLVDLQNTQIEILGRTYTILSSTQTPNAIELVGGAVDDLINLNERKSYTVDGTNYDVTLVFVDDDEAVFEVNGERTRTMEVGETYRLRNDVSIALTDIFYQDRNNGIERVEFTLGSNRITLEDGQEVEIEGDAVDGLVASISRTTPAAGQVEIQSISLTWSPEEDVSLYQNGSLTMPAFDSLELLMTGFTTPQNETLLVNVEGDETITLDVVVEDGEYGNLPILTSTGTGFTIIGEDTDQRLVTSATNTLTFDTDTDEMFVASWSSENDAESYILEVTSIEEDNGDVEVAVTNVITNQERTVDDIGDVVTFGRVELTLSAVDDAANTATFTINTDGSFNNLYTREGLRVILPVNDPAVVGGIDLGAAPTSYAINFVEEDEDEDISEGTPFNVTLNFVNGEASVAGTGGVQGSLSGDGFLEIGNSDNFVAYINSPLATRIEVDTSGDTDNAQITYHGSESYGNVYLQEAGFSGNLDEGNNNGGNVTNIPILRDNEVGSSTNRNLIIVGGSCINTLAAQVLGVSSPTCGTAFSARTGVDAGEYLIESFSRQDGRVAVLVAGYNAADTVNGARYLVNGNVDTAPGRRYIGTSSTSASAVNGTSTTNSTTS